MNIQDAAARCNDKNSFRGYLYLSHETVCVLDICMLFTCPSIKASDHLDEFEHTECLRCFFNCVKTLRCAYVQTVFPICTGFVKSILNAFRFIALTLSWHTLAITAPTHLSQLCQPSDRKF